MLVMYFFYTDYSSQNVEPFFNISLSLSRNLEQSLDDYVIQQQLTGDNLYNTQLYGLQRAKKSVRFLTLPPIIMVQLKRFQFNYNLNKNQKILHHFQYPQFIDFSKWQVTSEGKCNYQLYSVLVHQGLKAESGHYYAYVNINQQWYRFNDQQVTYASKLQVFDENFGGEINVVELDTRQLKICNKKTNISSTAYMLVYVKSDLKQRLLNSESVYPEWLNDHQTMKQQEKQELKNRKNYYYNITLLDWKANFENKKSECLGVIMKESTCDFGTIIQKIEKNGKVHDWIKPYNDLGLGVYLYLQLPDRTEYQNLINLQHRPKDTFRDLLKDSSFPIIFITFPLITKPGKLMFIVKEAHQSIQTENQSNTILAIFHSCLEIERSDRNSDLVHQISRKFGKPGHSLRIYYEQKKSLTEIRQDRNLVKSSQMQRNILGILIVEKIADQQVNRIKKMAQVWYNGIKNYLKIRVKSENEEYDYTFQVDKNNSLNSLREHIFKLISPCQGCSSPDNIILKAKAKKTSKNLIEIPSAQSIHDLVKNCQKENLITFGFSTLKPDQRKNQQEVKFIYRFADFSFSQNYFTFIDRKAQNRSQVLYHKILEHEDVIKNRIIENRSGIRILLLTKQKNVINDVVFENGYVHGKGQIAQVLQKQKTTNLVAISFPTTKIVENVCPILLHHRSLNDTKIGVPQYFQFLRSSRSTQLYDQILELIKEQVFEWQLKNIKCNPMKTTIYAYAKDYNKGCELNDEMQIRMDNEESAKKSSKQEVKIPSNDILQQLEQEKPLSPASDQPNQVNQGNQGKVDQKDESSNECKEIYAEQMQNGVQKVKAWQKTIDDLFPKAKAIKVIVKHNYLVKAQVSMKINVE